MEDIARWIIDKLPPLHSVLLGCIYSKSPNSYKTIPILSLPTTQNSKLKILVLIGLTITTFIGTFTLAGPIICAFLLDFGLQTTQIANRTAIYAIAPLARNRVNTAYMVSVFCGRM